MKLRFVAEQMGFIKAGPRDAVEIQEVTLKRKSRIATAQTTRAYVEVGRLMILELMRYLVSYYWNHPVGGGVSQHQVRKSSNVNPKSMKEEDNE